MELMTIPALASLVQTHVATLATPLPPATPGICWVFGADGLYKRGVNSDLDLLVPVASYQRGGAPLVPGLATLLPHVRFRSVPGRLPSAALGHILEHALRCHDGRPVARPIEQQYFVTYRADRPWKPIRVAVPPQDATAGAVRYALRIPGQILVDIHSHHTMRAYFSGVDDADDTGLSISLVIGTIFTRPEIVARLNVYGHRRRIPVELVFDGLGPFVEAAGGRDADAAA